MEVCADIATEDTEPTQNKKFLKTKKISYRDGVTDFHDEQIPKAGSNYTYLAVFNVNFVLKKGNYYPQAFLKECKYTEKEKESN